MVNFLFPIEGRNLLFIIVFNLAVSLFIMMRSAISIIEKKRILIFRSFFVFGLGLCLVTGFMFYGFFGIASDIYEIIKFVFIFGVVVVLIPRRGKR